MSDGLDWLVKSKTVRNFKLHTEELRFTFIVRFKGLKIVLLRPINCRNAKLDDLDGGLV